MTPKPGMIYLLMGPKGAGKTYLGTRMETELAIPFLRVEPIWLDLLTEMPADAPGFDEEGLQRVLREVRTLLEKNEQVVLESTGTAPWFSGFRSRLGELGTVILIRVRVPLAMCLERVQSRDAADHIAVSDDRVTEINEIADALDLPWNAVVSNESTELADQFIEAIRSGNLN